MTFTGSRDLSPYWAINGTHYAQDRRHPRDGRKPLPFQVFTHRNGLVVTRVRIKFPYAEPFGRRAKYAHVPRYAWIAWRKGQPIKSQVRFLCGGYSWTAQGVSEPRLPVCVKCRLVVTGSESVVACLDRIEKKQ